jgi:hypothetical protein
MRAVTVITVLTPPNAPSTRLASANSKEVRQGDLRDGETKAGSQLICIAKYKRTLQERRETVGDKAARCPDLGMNISWP